MVLEVTEIDGLCPEFLPYNIRIFLYCLRIVPFQIKTIKRTRKMSKLNMFEGICGSRAEILSKVRVLVYLIFNFSSDDSDPELRPQSSGSGTLTEHKSYSRHFVLSKIRSHRLLNI
jgi:hypothetical protein